jgi:hypothetical protein
MTHDDVWSAIEKFATEHGMSCSGLAKCSGLDPTTFNKSKRRPAVWQDAFVFLVRRSIIIAVSKVVQLICEIVQRVCDSVCENNRGDQVDRKQYDRE